MNYIQLKQMVEVCSAVAILSRFLLCRQDFDNPVDRFPELSIPFAEGLFTVKG